MKKFGKILFWIVIGLVLIQFISTDKVNKPVDQKKNFISVNKTPPQVAQLLRAACYDCHSDETIYPKYAYIAPISWSVKSHVNEGRHSFNLSVWTDYNKDLKRNILERAISDIQNRTMPYPGYIVYHKEADLNTKQREILIKYFEEMLKSGNY